MNALKAREFVLPATVHSSNDFKALDERAQQAFITRLKHIAEIGEKIAELNSDSYESEALLYQLEDIELDCFATMSLHSEHKGYVSPWLLHSSWTFECTSKGLFQSIDSVTLAALKEPGVALEVSTGEFVSWVKVRGELIQTQLRALMNASGFCSAVAAMICIDAILASLIFELTKTRFNATMRR